MSSMETSENNVFVDILPPLSIATLARYSFMQLSELWCCGHNENARASKQEKVGFETMLV